MKKIFFLMILGLFLITLYSNSVNAQLKVGIEPVKDILLPINGEKAIFLIDITNDGVTAATFSYVPSDLNWEWDYLSIDVPANSKRTIQTELAPPKNLKAGIYTINLKFYSLLNPNVKDINPVVIQLIDFNKAIGTEFIYNPNGLVPGRQNILKLGVKNNVKLPLNNLKINLKSSLFDLEKTINIGESDRVEIELYPEIKEGAIKDQYDVTVTASINDKPISREIKKILVGSVKDVQENKKVDSKFLVNSVILKRTNNGNDISQEVYSQQFTTMQKLFTRTNPSPSFVDKRNGIYTYTWYFTLKPGESYSVNARTSYVKLLLSIIILIIAVFLIIYFKGALTISKRVLSVKKDESIVETKVLINVKNRSRNRIKDIRIVDRLPRIMIAPYTYGSLHPSSASKDDRGCLLVWNINELRPGEERVISYRTKAAKAVHGKLIFPAVVLRYKTKSYKLVTTSSGTVTVSSKIQQ